jgi:hypothetical protein
MTSASFTGQKAPGVKKKATLLLRELLLGPLLAGGWPFELMAQMRVTPTAAANISARQNRILR